MEKITNPIEVGLADWCYSFREPTLELHSLVQAVQVPRHFVLGSATKIASIEPAGVGTVSDMSCCHW